MRVNGKKVTEIMEQKGLTAEMVCSRTTRGMSNCGREDRRKCLCSYSSVMGKNFSAKTIHSRTAAADGREVEPEIISNARNMGMKWGENRFLSG